jgi:hypothetical protein
LNALPDVAAAGFGLSETGVWRHTEGLNDQDEALSFVEYVLYEKWINP